MDPELTRLADTCGLSADAAQAVMAGARLPVVAARLLGPDELSEQFGIAINGPAVAGRAGAIWLPVPTWPARASSEQLGQACDGKLALRYLGGGLPFIVVALASGDVAIAVAVLLWDTSAMRWLEDVVERQAFSLVIEPEDGGAPSLVTGHVQLPRQAVRDLFETEFSVDASDRGHALRAAALMAVAAMPPRVQPQARSRGARQTVVGVVTQHVLDLGELASLVSLAE